MKAAFLPAYGPTSFSSFLSMAIAMGALSTEQAAEMAEKEGGMERPEEEQAFDRGCLAAQFGRYEEAVEIFTGLLAQKPDDRAALYNRALSFLCLHRYNEANIDFDRILRHEHGRVSVLINLTHLFLATMSPAQAQQKARLVLQLDPHSPAGAINLGHCLIHSGRVVEAEEAYNRAVTNNLNEVIRTGLIAGMVADVKEFQEAGWPEAKLEEIALQIRCLEVRLSRKEMLEVPALDGREGFLGASLDILRTRNEFFSWFHFEPVGKGEPLTGGVITEFRPSGPAFRPFVALRVTTDQDKRIRTLSLEIARRFIDDPKNGIFAADLAKSFLRNVAAPYDRPVLDELASEIEAKGMLASSGLMARGTVPDDVVSRPLSPAGCVYFGRTESWETRLGRSLLTLAHVQNPERIFRIEMKSLTASRRVDQSKSWLNQLWTNLSGRKNAISKEVES
jgi:tetratricopeptide (TPR) repeat protein